MNYELYGAPKQTTGRETLRIINNLEIHSEFLDDVAECAEGIRDDEYAYKSDIRDRLQQAIVWNTQAKIK